MTIAPDLTMSTPLRKKRATQLSQHFLEEANVSAFHADEVASTQNEIPGHRVTRISSDQLFVPLF